MIGKLWAAVEFSWATALLCKITTNLKPTRLFLFKKIEIRLRTIFYRDV